MLTALTGCCPLRRTPFSNLVRMRTRTLVPTPKTTVIGLGARLVHTGNCVLTGMRISMVPVRYRPNAASGGWSYGRDLVALP